MLTAQPLADDPALNQLSQRLSTNVPPPERTLSLYGGIGLLGLALARRSGTLALLGGALIYRGITGQCHVYRALGIHSRGMVRESGTRGHRGRKVVETILIRRPRAEVFRFWRELENLPRFMPHLEKVEVVDEFRSRWVVRAIAGTSMEWQAEIINERENELLAWQSLPGADLQNAGSVWFEDAPEGGTRLKVAIEYYKAAGVIGDAVARVFGEAPEQQLKHDLQRLKDLLEAQPPVRTGGAFRPKNLYGGA